MVNPSLDRFMEMGGQKVSIERSGSIIAEYQGLPNHDKRGKKYFAFYPGSDVAERDWIIDSAGKRYYVEDAETDIIHGSPFQLKAYTLTETEVRKSNSSPATFNIEYANNSVIGTQNYAVVNCNDCISQMRDQIAATNSSDKNELTEIVDLLERILANQTPPQKGLFSRFSAVMERNSWISGTMASSLLSWLLTNV